MSNCLMSGVLTFAFRAWFDAMDRNEEPSFGNSFHFVCTVVILTVVFIVATKFWSVLISVKASMNMHKRMVESVLGSPISWFDSNPVGRVLNRFSTDMFSLDSCLMSNMMKFYESQISLAVTLFTTLIVCPDIWIVLLLLSLAALYYVRLYVRPA